MVRFRIRPKKVRTRGEYGRALPSAQPKKDTQKRKNEQSLHSPMQVVIVASNGEEKFLCPPLLPPPPPQSILATPVVPAVVLPVDMTLTALATGCECPWSAAGPGGGGGHAASCRPGPGHCCQP